MLAIARSKYLLNVALKLGDLIDRRSRHNLQVASPCTGPADGPDPERPDRANFVRFSFGN
jgi:hypothetical protein